MVHAGRPREHDRQCLAGLDRCSAPSATTTSTTRSASRTTTGSWRSSITRTSRRCRVQSNADREKKRQIESQIADLEAKLKEATPELEETEAKWERGQSAAAATWRVLKVREVKSAHGAELAAATGRLGACEWKDPGQRDVHGRREIRPAEDHRLSAGGDGGRPLPPAAPAPRRTATSR